MATTWKRVLILAVLCVGLAVVASSDVLHSLLLRVLAAGEAIIITHPLWGASVFVLLSAVSAMLAFMTTAVIVPVAVYAWGETLSIMLLWIGWILGGVCAYGVGRSLRGRALTSFIPTRALAYGDHVSARASFSLVLLFQLALPSEVPGYVLGLIRYDFAKYVVALGLAELPYAVATVFLGAGLIARRTLVLFVVGSIVAVLSAWAAYALHKRLTA